MFKKKYRADRILFRSAHTKIHTPYFTLLVLKNNVLYSRFSVVVSKKVDPRAVIRNQVKRRIRDCLNTLSDRVRIGYDMIIIVKKELASKLSSESLEIIETNLRKEGLLQ